MPRYRDDEVKVMKFEISAKRLLLSATVVGLVCLLVLVQKPADKVRQQDPTHTAIKVEIVAAEGGYQLLRGGQPYVVKGAGIDNRNLQSLVDHGANSLRTWSVDDGAQPAEQLLDRASSLGLTVSLGLEFSSERHGFNYDDAVDVATQFEQARARVLKYRDHPALLVWIIGNELNFNSENPKVYDALNDVVKMIHALDPNHPTTTALSYFDTKALNLIGARAPDLDFVSFQLYAGLLNLPVDIAKTGYRKPYFVTEWGSVGHWEVAKTSWGAPIENTSSEKASNYLKSYQEVLQPHADQAIGNYVFLWGQKQEKTPTWYGMYLNSGEETEAIDVMHYIWNGRWPDNRSPRVSPIRLNGNVAQDNVSLEGGKRYSATLDVTDFDDDPITYRWVLRAESAAEQVGGDYEELPEVIAGLIEDPTAAEITLLTPTLAGGYRLFVYVYDGQNHAAHANIPFYVR